MVASTGPEMVFVGIGTPDVAISGKETKVWRKAGICYLVDALNACSIGFVRQAGNASIA